MTPMPSLTASSANASPIRTFRSSDSTTHGPAMRNGLLSAANRWGISVRELGQLAPGLGRRVPLAVAERGADEAREQRMRTHGTRFELGMELASDEPRMIGELDRLDERAIRRQTGTAHAVLRKHIAIRVRDLVAMAMAFAHFRRVIRLGHV